MIKLFITDVSELSGTSLFSDVLSRVSPLRREKVLALKKQGDRMLSLGAGYLLEKTLASEFGLSPDELIFTEKGNGKPCLKNREDICFSLSHSGTKAALAVSENEIGADIQAIKPFKEAFAKKILSASEFERIMLLPSEERPAAFINNWAMKESYMKFTGLGLSIPVRSLEIHYGENGTPVLYRNGIHIEDISLISDSISDCYFSVCTCGSKTPFILEKDLTIF